MARLTKHQAELRARVLTDARWLIAHQLIEGYSMARPYARPPYPPTQHFANDCSGTLKLLFEWAGIPSQDGEAWGYGNTATMANAKGAYHVPMNPGDWFPLDHVFYKEHSGPFQGGGGEHVTMLTHKEDGHWHVISHGSDSGPKNLPYDYRSDFVAVRRYRLPAK